VRRFEWVYRFGLGVASLVLLWVAEHQLFGWDLARSFEYLGLIVLAGLVLGIAAWLPLGWRYEWGPPLALGAIPFLMLAQSELLLYRHAHYLNLPSWLDRWLNRPYFFNDLGPQFVLAIMLGVALSAGFVG
jgi:hypothetical protein